MTTATQKKEPDSTTPMKVEYGGKVYRIVFTHWDNRYRVIRDEEGTVVQREAQHPKRIKRDGLAQTTCYIHEVTGRDEKGRDTFAPGFVAMGHVKCSPKDHFNRAHGRWYALERALLDIADDRLRRALRKAYYAGTTWRPDGRDGFKIDKTYHKIPQLVRVGR